MAKTISNNKSFNGLAKMILDFRARGPILLIIGFYMLIFRIQPENIDSTLQIVKICISSILILAGIIMMFFQASRTSKSIPLTTIPESSSDLEKTINELSKNYSILRRQTTKDFT